MFLMTNHVGLVLVVLACLSGCQTSYLFGSSFTSMEAYVSHHNSRTDVTWKATAINFRHIPAADLRAYIKNLCGTKPHPAASKLPRKTYVAPVIPDAFDARVQWPHCPSVREIRDQGSCGSCWAFGCVEAATDRLCIQSGGAIQTRLSAEDPVSCCGEACSPSLGCDGGFTEGAWEFLWREGIVSGGRFNSSQGCRPYEIETCDHHGDGSLKPCPHERAATPSCHNSCIQGYNRTYQDDKHYGKKPYIIFGEEAIQTEIMSNGPVECALFLYDDFYLYHSGVYKHNKGAKGSSGHAVKLIGWGVEHGLKYWTVANSWNTHWGDKGFVKIIRGVGEMNIENACVAAMMQV